MKRVVLMAVCTASLVALCTSCLFLFGESFRSRDSLENATTNWWAVAPQFASGWHERYQHETYLQAPQTFCGYQATGRRDPLPVLTNIVVSRMGQPLIQQYSLSPSDISKLREASGGDVRLLLYDEGLVCMSPGMKKALAVAGKERPYNKQDHFLLLRQMKNDALRWTRSVLGTR